MPAKKKPPTRKTAARKKKARKPKKPAAASDQFVILLDGSGEESYSAAHVELEVNHSIDDVAELHERLQAALDSGEGVTIDTGGVRNIDTAALQLLCAFSRSAAAREVEVSWQHRGSAFADAARCLGLCAELGID